MTVDNPRLRLLLGTQWRLIVAALVVVALLSFGTAAASYGERPTETVTQTTNKQTVATTSTHQATVVANDSLWPRGTVLEDKPVYLLNDTPTVNVSATTAVDGASGAAVTHVWRLALTATRGESTFYSETETLANVTRRSTDVTTGVTLDPRSIADRMATIRKLSEGITVVAATLKLEVSYCTDPGGGCRYTGSNTYSTPLRIGDKSYEISGEMAGSTDHSSSQQSEVPQPRNWTPLVARALVGILALAGAGAVVSTEPREIDVGTARQDLHRTQYEEWISPGVIPMGISQQFVELETIEDVVDVAIDTNERVVYDRRRDLYAVISENVVYYFSTGGSWMESAFRGMEFDGDGPRPGDSNGDGPFAGAGGPGGDGPFDGGPGGDGPDAEEFGFPAESEGPFGDGEDGAATFEGEDEESPFGGGGDGAPSPFGGEDEADESPFGGEDDDEDR
jgi:hypothetical protein